MFFESVILQIDCIYLCFMTGSTFSINRRLKDSKDEISKYIKLPLMNFIKKGSVFSV